jgi:hypothetical protein
MLPSPFPSPLTAPSLHAGGGGGIGIHICRTEEEVVTNFASAARQGAAAFGDAGVFVEKYVQVRGQTGGGSRGGLGATGDWLAGCLDRLQ